MKPIKITRDPRGKNTISRKKLTAAVKKILRERKKAEVTLTPAPKHRGRLHPSLPEDGLM
jgi:hypothetical protein